MADDVLQISVVADVSGLKAGMDEAQAIVGSATSKQAADFAALEARTIAAFGSMAKAPQGVRDALALLNSEAMKLDSNAEVAAAVMRDLDQAMKEVESDANGAAGALDNVNAATGRTISGSRAATIAMSELRGGFTGNSRAAGVFLANVLGLGPILQAAFPVLGAIAFGEILIQLVSKTHDLTDAVMGWDAAAKKAYADNVAANVQLLKQSDDLYQKHLLLNTTALEGGAKQVKTKQDLEAVQKRLSAELGDELREEQKIQQQIALIAEEKRKLISGQTLGGTILGPVAQITEAVSGLPAINADADKLEKSLDNVRKRAQDLESTLRNLSGLELPKIDADTAKEQIDQRLAAARSQIDAIKSVSESSIAFQQQSARELLSLGVITQEQEIAMLRTAENQKYEVERESIKRRRDLANEEHRETGKDVTPQLTAAEADAEKLEVEHQARLSAINTAGELERRKAANDSTLATIDAERQKTEALATLDEQSAREQLARHQITIEEETKLLERSEVERFNAEKTALDKRLSVLMQYEEKNKAEIIRVHGEIESSEIQHQARMDSIAAEGATKIAEETRRRMREEVEAVQQSSTLQLSIENQRDNARLKAHKESLSTWQADELAALASWYAAQREVYERALQMAKQTYGENSTEYRRMIDKLNQLDLEHQKKLDEINTKTWQSFNETYQRITSTINSNITQMLTAQETLADGARNIYVSLLTEGINYLERLVTVWVRDHIVMKLASRLFHLEDAATAQAAEAQKEAAYSAALVAHQAETSAANVAVSMSEAAVAAAGTFAWYSAVNPPLALPMAEAAYAIGTSFAGLAAFEKGGIVPETQIALVHAGERVIPQADVGAIDRAVNFLSSSSTVSHSRSSTIGGSNDTHIHVTPQVQAIDSRSVKEFFDENTHEIARQIKRALRRGMLNRHELIG